MQNMGKKRWFRLGLIGWLSTTGLTIALVSGICYVFFSGVSQSGIPLDEKLVIQIYEEDSQYFGRKGKKKIVGHTKNVSQGAVAFDHGAQKKGINKQVEGVKKAEYI